MLFNRDKIIKIRREFGYSKYETFKCKPIGRFVDYYLNKSKISIDPFARNFNGATFTNDLNPKTDAQYHMRALDFLLMMEKKHIDIDLIIFDPPYSLRQCKEMYESVGNYKFTIEDSQNLFFKKEKKICAKILKKDGIFLHFGFHSNGLGMKKGFSVQEILLVAHGTMHDTICMAEKKTSEQLNLF